LWDYLTGGIGPVYLPVESDGAPEFRWADTLDMNWDQTARLPCDMRWVSIVSVQPLWVWLEMFPKSSVLKTYAGTQARDSMGRFSREGDDRPTELEFYYDLEGEGAYKCFLKRGDRDWDPEPVMEDRSPHRAEIFGKERAFLPVESIFFMAIPSVRLPISNAEKMLPAQIAVWKTVNRIQAIIERGKGFYEIGGGALEKEEIDAFMEAYEGGVVFSKDIGKIYAHEPLQLQQADLEELTRNLQEMNLQGGVSPYSMGAKAPGVELATEARLIAGQGELTTGTVSTANARLWEAACTKFLWNGKTWDENPFTCNINDIPMEFSEGSPLGPVNQYLRPDSPLSVAEDSTTFRSREQLIQEAMLDLDKATQLAQLFPAGVAPAYRRFLRAIGADDIEDRLAAPMPTAVMPGQTGPTAAAMAEGATQ
jgi:hypothetical protein